MKIISFSGTEILPALLNKTKTQTIRPCNLPQWRGIRLCKVCGKQIPKQNWKYCSDKCYKSIIKNKKRNEEDIKKIKIGCQKRNQTGIKNPNWNGGVTKKRNIIFNSPEYAEWRRKVFERDDFTCQDCGLKGDGNNLIAHHIKSFTKYPELRFDVNNGKTLCKEDHRVEHNEKGGYRYGV